MDTSGYWWILVASKNTSEMGKWWTMRGLVSNRCMSYGCLILKPTQMKLPWKSKKCLLEGSNYVKHLLAMSQASKMKQSPPIFKLLLVSFRLLSLSSNKVHGSYFAVIQNDVFMKFISCWHHRNSSRFYGCSQVELCKSVFFSPLQNASKLVPSSPNFGKMLQERLSIHLAQVFAPAPGVNFMFEEGAQWLCMWILEHLFQSFSWEGNFSVLYMSLIYREYISSRHFHLLENRLEVKIPTVCKHRST